MVEKDLMATNEKGIKSRLLKAITSVEKAQKKVTIGATVMTVALMAALVLTGVGIVGGIAFSVGIYFSAKTAGNSFFNLKRIREEKDSLASGGLDKLAPAIELYSHYQKEDAKELLQMYDALKNRENNTSKGNLLNVLQKNEKNMSGNTQGQFQTKQTHIKAGEVVIDFDTKPNTGTITTSTVPVKKPIKKTFIDFSKFKSNKEK